MFKAIRKIDEKVVEMSSTFQRKENCKCLCCGNDVVAKMGAIKIWHFAHKNKATCSYSEKTSNGMSDFHRDIQLEFKKIGAELEKKIEKNIADVFFNDRVYEIQHSPIKHETILNRNDVYFKNTNKKVVWILDGKTQNLYKYPRDILKVIINNCNTKKHEKNARFVYQEYEFMFHFDSYKELLLFLIDEKKVNKEFEKKIEEIKKEEHDEYIKEKINKYMSLLSKNINNQQADPSFNNNYILRFACENGSELLVNLLLEHEKVIKAGVYEAQQIAKEKGFTEIFNKLYDINNIGVDAFLMNMQKEKMLKKQKEEDERQRIELEKKELEQQEKLSIEKEIDRLFESFNNHIEEKRYRLACDFLLYHNDNLLFKKNFDKDYAIIFFSENANEIINLYGDRVLIKIIKCLLLFYKPSNEKVNESLSILMKKGFPCDLF